MPRTVRKKKSTAYTVAELERLTADLDREFIADTFGAPPARVRARLQKAKRGRGRPRVGAGAVAVAITIEKKLLQQVDRLARRRRTSRSKLIATGLRALLRERPEDA